MIQISATIDHDKDEISMSIEKDGVKIVLNKAEWEEIKETMRGDRNIFYTYSAHDKYQRSKTCVFGGERVDLGGILSVVEKT